ncbi:hypothetical protein N7520_002538 [Penicillium odoratum]|uniref:uncharacterized protein n=1 Tax=Penicillium odoratum TaxID=1167516 RepID=UPI002549726B|nr:uncharacterized protein N7520_002538 [Penicillium odoratum]KAJ5772009.1 hypothetical protein N7520_002538 [Penicillium odoratum]
MEESVRPTPGQHGKQPACLNCRRSKIRCARPEGHDRCEKCRQSDVECIVPSHQLGRQKGVKNKRKGLEKAIHQIEQAIKRPKLDAVGPYDKAISDLQDLLSRVQGQLASDSDSFAASERPPPPAHDNVDESLALDDAENPLQLLARASDLQLSPTELRRELKSPQPPSVPKISQNSSSTDFSAKSFFVPTRANLDVGPELDPVDLGLVTFDESESLFSFFYQHLAHTRWGLDPFVHTAEFVRDQSAFLFTSILATAALFLPSAAALSKRLGRHCKWLAKQVMTERYRSVEIVLAFMVNVPWMAPGERLGDDDTCSYIAMALTVALDLSLNKIVTPSSSFDQNLLSRLARADCIDAKKALQMDGFDVDSNSEWGRRLLRRRERTWIALFVVERGVCLARGRSYTVPPTALLENCDAWHLSDIADRRDGPMNSMAVLRRDLSSPAVISIESSTPDLRLPNQSFYDRWYKTWALAISEGGTARSLPPYVEILVTHTQLSTYGGVINHPTAPLEVKRFFRAAGLSAALNVLRAAIQGESRLKSMPNNTVIMISFAACSALSLSVTPGDSRSSLAPSVRTLIEETAGKWRFCIIWAISARTYSPGTYHSPRADGKSRPLASSPLERPVSVPQPVTGDLWTEPMQFSAMSDGQIIDAVNRAGSAFGASIPDVPVDDMLCWDWFDFANTDFGL